MNYWNNFPNEIKLTWNSSGEQQQSQSSSSGGLASMPEVAVSFQQTLSGPASVPAKKACITVSYTNFS